MPARPVIWGPGARPADRRLPPTPRLAPRWFAWRPTAGGRAPVLVVRTPLAPAVHGREFLPPPGPFRAHPGAHPRAAPGVRRVRRAGLRLPDGPLRWPRAPGENARAGGGSQIGRE